MANRLLALAAAIFIAAAIPSLGGAQTLVIPQGEIVPIEAVREIARDHGMDRIEMIELNTFTGRWEVEGTDFADRDVDMEIDANTGAVVSLER